MSDIREPAQNDSPTTPGDEGKSTASITADAVVETPSAAPAAAEASASADGAEAPAAADGAEGAAVDGAEGAAAEGGEGAAAEGGEGAAAEGGEGGEARRRNRKRNRGPKGEGGGEARAHGNHAGSAQQPRAFKNGDKVRARVIELVGATAVLDLWGKEKGLIDLREVQGEDGAPPAIGEGYDVEVIQDGARGGNVVVTRDPERVQKGRVFVKESFESGAVVEALVTGMNKGGLELDLNGVRAFCPSSQIDVRFPPSISPKSLLNQRMECRVTALADDGREAIVSRRALMEASVRAR
jgi:small subunit ribosomal protein S1